MQKNKLFLPNPPAKNKNKMKLPPLLDERGRNKNVNRNGTNSFDDKLLENQTEQLLLDLMKKS